MENRIVILDFGSQYTQLIARRTRELGIYSEIYPYYLPVKKLKSLLPRAIILSGGPSSVYQKESPNVSKEIFSLGIPILGICYGQQVIAGHLGAKIIPANDREYGFAQLKVLDKSHLLKGVKNLSKVWMSHGDKLKDLPLDFSITGSTNNTKFAVIESTEKNLFGIQFHPEVVHTKEGKKILKNFLFDISKITPDWNMKNFIDTTTQRLRDKIGSEKVILGLSGGVDSTVLALLLKKAIKGQLIPVFVDTGLLRKNEFNNLMNRFKKELNLKVRGISAGEIFLKRLSNISSPEKKRKIIGNTFIDVFKGIQKEVGKVKYFAQGTLYPDVIESVSVKGPSATIKSHHNVGGLPRKMNWELIEPFKELFKDEVRIIGRELGLKEEFINRHPFPGPGLSVRILGPISQDKIKILQEADNIMIEELHNFNLYNKIWQAFVVLLPVNTVGVMGDQRTYEKVAAIRLVESIDGMTADWFKAPHDFLNKTANRIVNEVKGINRVVYDITSKPPATIEWE